MNSPSIPSAIFCAPFSWMLRMRYRELEESGVMMPVIKMECDYVKAAKYDDLLTIKTIIKEMPKIRMHFYYEIYNEAAELINKGETTLVFVDKNTKKLTHCPHKLANELAFLLNLSKNFFKFIYFY